MSSDTIQELKNQNYDYENSLMPAKIGKLIIEAGSTRSICKELENLNSIQLVNLMNDVKLFQGMLQPNTNNWPKLENEINMQAFMESYNITQVKQNNKLKKYMPKVVVDYFDFQNSFTFKRTINRCCIDKLRNVRPNLIRLTQLMENSNMDNTIEGRNKLEERIFIGKQ